MKTKLKINLLAILFVSIVTGCIHEKVDNPETDPSSLILRVQLSEGGEGRSTEAGETSYGENAIEHLAVVFYHGGTKVWEAVPTVQSVGNYIIPVPQHMYGQFDGTKEFNIYLIANVHGFAGPNSETDLPKKVISNDIAVSSSSGTPPDKFAMYGFTSKQINMATSEGKQLGNINLKRVAAKIRLKSPTVIVEGYTMVGLPQAKYRNYVNKGYLQFEDIPSGADAGGVIPYKELNEANGTVHFYSYYNQWEETTPADQRPELILMIKLKQDGQTDNLAKAYYYRVPINASDNKIRSNYLYDMSVTIEVLGGLEEENPIALNGTFCVLPWSEHADDQTLPDTQYLEVIPQESVMNLITETHLDYKSSSTIEIKDVKASYTFVNGETGIETTVHYHPNQTAPESHIGQFPIVTEESGKIKVSSILPVNNVPKKITFTVKNLKGGLTKQVTIVQNPSEYVVHTMGTASYWQPGGNLAPGLNNKAIYHIVILAPTGDMVTGFPPRENKDFYYQNSPGVLGGWVYSDDVTNSSTETSQMVSPSFELASQLGATVIQPYEKVIGGYNIHSNYASGSAATRNALGTCAEYWEKRVVNGAEVILNDWRLPTKKEVELVYRLQKDPKSAVKAIMTGKYYWSNLKHPAIHNPDGEFVNNVSESRAHVRCVRDVKDDIRKKK